MKRTTISLPDDLAWALEREAQRQATSASAVARQALAEHLDHAPDRARDLPFAGLGDSEDPSLAGSLEDVLAEEWGAAVDRDR